ncbi:MAG: hypothetical protein WBF90_33790 [Rivularia sp. (in: cyanobacteria)]
MKSIVQIIDKLSQHDDYVVDELIEYQQSLEQVGGNSKRMFDQIEASLPLKTVNWLYEQLNSTTELEPLTEELTIAKNECEQRIETSLKDFIQRGKDFAFIRENKLYRKEYCSWATYCKYRFGIAHSTADRLIAAYQISKQLQPIGGFIPNESVARELYKIKEESRTSAWLTLLKQSKKLDKPVTAAMVAAVAKESEPHAYIGLPEGKLVAAKQGSKFIAWGMLEKVLDNTAYLYTGAAKRIAIPSKYLVDVLDKSVIENYTDVFEAMHLGDEKMRSICRLFFKEEKLSEWEINIIKSINNVINQSQRTAEII